MQINISDIDYIITGVLRDSGDPLRNKIPGLTLDELLAHPELRGLNQSVVRDRFDRLVVDKIIELEAGRHRSCP
jgi:hypothetical protein